MKRFKFRLQKILELRESAEEEARGVLAKAQRELDSLTTQLADLEQKRVNLQGGAEMLASEFLLSQDFLRGVLERKAILEDAREKQRTKVAQARAELIEKRRDAEVLRTLREGREQEWRTEIEKKEQEMLDEIATFAVSRGENGNG